MARYTTKCVKPNTCSRDQITCFSRLIYNICFFPSNYHTTIFKVPYNPLQSIIQYMFCPQATLFFIASGLSIPLVSLIAAIPFLGPAHVQFSYEFYREILKWCGTLTWWYGIWRGCMATLTGICSVLVCYFRYHILTLLDWPRKGVPIVYCVFFSQRKAVFNH